MKIRFINKHDLNRYHSTKKGSKFQQIRSISTLILSHSNETIKSRQISTTSSSDIDDLDTNESLCQMQPSIEYSLIELFCIKKYRILFHR